MRLKVNRWLESIQVQLLLHLSTIAVPAFGLDARVRKYATTLQDKKSLAKLCAGGLVARETKYHAHCLASLYKEAAERVKDEGKEDGTSPGRPEGIALVELDSFNEKSRMVSTAEIRVFRLAERVHKYTPRLKLLGENAPARTDTTRLKDYILSQIPAVDEEHRQGSDVMSFWPSKMILLTSATECSQERL